MLTSIEESIKNSCNLLTCSLAIHFVCFDKRLSLNTLDLYFHFEGGVYKYLFCGSIPLHIFFLHSILQIVHIIMGRKQTYLSYLVGVK